MAGLYSQEEVDDAVRRSLNPYKIGTYLPAAETGIVLTAATRTKISLPVSVVGAPNGFDIYLTDQGNALRFIGSGLGNGDTAIIRMDTMASILAATGSSTSVAFGACTRHYTEPLFTEAIDIPGYSISRKMPNNDEGAVALNAPFFELSDGDLIEICGESVQTITINITKFGFEAIELN